MSTRHEIGHSQARVVVDCIADELIERDVGAAVAVVDSHGELVSFFRSDDCPLPSINNAVNKAFTAAREGVPSKVVGDRSQDENFPLTYYGDPRYIGWGGGFPIVIDGTVIGAVGVSGLPEEDDMEIAQYGIDRLLASM